MTTLNSNGVSHAMPSQECSEDDTYLDFAPELWAKLQAMGAPSLDELREADKIVEEAMRPYEEKSYAEQRRSERCLLLEEYIAPHLLDLSLPPPVMRPIIEREGVMVASLGNISAVVGAAKSKKTFLCSAIVGGLLAGNDNFGITHRFAKVLWVDTEQSVLHARRVVERIHRLAGLDVERNSPLLHLLTLREIEPKRRAEIVQMAIELYQPQLVVVDGISDLMNNTNDIEESDRIVGQLMALSTEHNCHILCVLHTNPNSDKARGHIGSTLQRKAETVLFVHKVGEVSVVEPQFCRNEEFAPFAFRINEEGLPELTPLPNEKEQENECAAILRAHYPNGIERNILVAKIVELLGVASGYAQVKISRALRSGAIVAADNVIHLP